MLDHSSHSTLLVIGGGTMTHALLSAWQRQDPSFLHHVEVVEPSEERRLVLHKEFGVRTHSETGAATQPAERVLWAVKPQQFGSAAGPAGTFNERALHISIMAGIPVIAIARATGSQENRVVRAMPNLAARTGRSLTSLYMKKAAGSADRDAVQKLFVPAGQTVWMHREEEIDMATALSGSGPALALYVMEAMQGAGMELGMQESVARQLVVAAFEGAVTLAMNATHTLAELRLQITSSGGTTHAAIGALESAGVTTRVASAVTAAQHRAAELGREIFVSIANMP